MRIAIFAVALCLLSFTLSQSIHESTKIANFPLVLTTWNFVNATKTAFTTMMNTPGSNGLDGVEKGCNFCENNPNQCDFTVGYGGSPNDLGETTLDAMIMWAPTFQIGSVGCVKGIKNVISVARKVMELTEHTMLVGEDATNFATQVGFTQESLTTERSANIYANWVAGNCTPNYWTDQNYANCPPFEAESLSQMKDTRHLLGKQRKSLGEVNKGNHDTIGMVVIDSDGNLACGTSTNGKQYKIHGRVGDSPIPGAGAYCDQDIGGAATGDGDIMMRFLPSLRAVEELRKGVTPTEAAVAALLSIQRYYPGTQAGIIVLGKDGTIGAASLGFNPFTYNYQHPLLSAPVVVQIPPIG